MVIIGHLDMDAFFAAVEEREMPWLRGSPIVVGADPKGGVGRGVVSTANYKAREYGIHSAMSIRRAWELSQTKRKKRDLPTVFITPRFDKYSNASREIVSIVKKYVPKIQKVGTDEMYLDLSCTGSYKKAEALANQLQTAIKRKTKLTGSIGIGPNKMIAKIASDFKKPSGLTVVSEDAVQKFIAPLPVRTIPGIGPKMEERLLRLGIQTVAELRQLSKDELQRRFQSWGVSLYEKARGHGSAEFSTHEKAKSIGEHRTFQEDTHDMRLVMKTLAAMAEGLVHSLKQQKFSGFRTVALTVRFADFETKQRSVTTKSSMQNTHELELKAMKLLLPFFEKGENPYKKAVRMVGLRVEKLS